MELVLLGAGLVALIVIAKVGMAYLRGIKAQTGYNPLGFLNCLMIIGLFVLPITGLAMLESDSKWIGILLLIGAVACLVGLIVRNCVLKNPGKIILVTFFQLFAPALTLLGFLYKTSGGIMGNAVTRANLGDTSYTGSTSGSGSKASGYDYTSGQEDLAKQYGFSSAEEAKKHGVDVKKML